MTVKALAWRTDRKVAWPMKKLGHALLGATEGAMLYYLARDWVPGNGQIVELGSFLGASASLLAKGLRDNSGRSNEARVHCYDLWEAKFGGLSDFIRRKVDPDFQDGADFMHLFSQQVCEVADLIVPHKCHFEDAVWDDGPIELLFIDIAKTPTLNRVVLDRFLPCIPAEEGLFVQQDLHNPDNPWIQTSLGHLVDYLEIIEKRADDSALFRLRKTIPDDVLRQVGRFLLGSSMQQGRLIPVRGQLDRDPSKVGLRSY